jgi:uncharacterized MAPEG superfamily protein
MTSLFWIPYLINRIIELGVWGTLKNPNPTAVPKSLWASRMIQAHRNAVENLVIFAPLTILLSLSEHHPATAANASMLYFFARLAHFVFYSFGVPFFRTVAFLAGWIAQITVAVALLRQI